ncbi:MAG: ankyrin repeat domain-containing protein [Alphaproteobacteria bacterium]|nr:ankyrin repeat domain-containing protein [Alphaproteobacteria bacterium]MBR6363541.1 ankyrin repeat domain-containing protein [Alphaproteobacteria bacterium]
MKRFLLLCSCLFLFACDTNPQEPSLAQMEMRGISWENVSLNLVKRRIKKGDDINAVEPTEYGWTILGRASASTKTKNIVKYLIDAGADVNKKDKTGATALMKAGLSGDIEIVKMLIDAGADVNARTYTGDTALLYAINAQNANPDIIKLLVNSGADVNAIGEYSTCFGSICSKKDSKINNEEMLKFFISKGAKVNIKHNILGTTPLMSSVYSGKVETVKFLLDNGADINAKNDLAQTVIHIAAWQDNAADIINFLASKKISLETPDKFGRTPLVSAIIAESPANIQALINNGAKINVSYEGLTLLELATSESKNQEVVRTLLKNGIKPTNKALNIANDTIKKSDVYWEIHDILPKK